MGRAIELQLHRSEVCVCVVVEGKVTVKVEADEHWAHSAKSWQGATPHRHGGAAEPGDEEYDRERGERERGERQCGGVGGA